MKFKIDHDLHIHSKLSTCSSHPEQTCENILKYAVKSGFSTVCITDHHWDANVEGMSAWYKKQGDVYSVLPLPQHESCKFLFGCEVDMDKNFNVGISPQHAKDFDFIIVPTTHLHMTGFTYDEKHDNVEDKTNLFVKRFEAFLNADLPFEKVGLAHITCSLIHRENDGYLQVLNNVSDSTFERLFKGCADVGCGVELNIGRAVLWDSDKLTTVLRPYEIAKKMGCKFYLGSDGHSPEGLYDGPARFERMIDLLQLTEEHKFVLK